MGEVEIGEVVPDEGKPLLQSSAGSASAASGKPSRSWESWARWRTSRSKFCRVMTPRWNISVLILSRISRERRGYCLSLRTRFEYLRGAESMSI